jgi:hypothetical protein
MRGIYRVAEDLLASQAGLSSIESVSQSVRSFFRFYSVMFPDLRIMFYPSEMSLFQNRKAAGISADFTSSALNM